MTLKRMPVGFGMTRYEYEAVSIDLIVAAHQKVDLL